ncbi:MAG: Rrf2 family transcriptional regulator [Saprospiraceae bacterium]|jgi:Rrf2 family protein|nr:Rrf2 family transcriptional regulator [Saprospiraceae bacterium]
MLPKKTRYAVKALMVLYKTFESKQPIRISDIAENENIPKKFLEAILLDLRKIGIVNSKMGAHGGYYLSKHPDEIFLSQIIRFTGGPIALVPCVSLNFYERCEECTDEATCGFRDVMREVRDASLHILSKTSLEDLVQREKTLGKPVE